MTANKFPNIHEQVEKTDNKKGGHLPPPFDQSDYTKQKFCKKCFTKYLSTKAALRIISNVFFPRRLTRRSQIQAY